jgi:hypothetical protein
VLESKFANIAASKYIMKLNVFIGSSNILNTRDLSHGDLPETSPYLTV